MIKRIVKLTFREGEVDNFLKNVFEPSKNLIRTFPGCQNMELLRQDGRENVLFTLSIWESGEDLENYRKSELFRATWEKTKALFAQKAEAWSLEVLDEDSTLRV